MQPGRKLFLTLFAVIAVMFTMSNGYSRAAAVNYYQLKIYHYKTSAQQTVLHSYLQNAYLPALHRNGIKLAGVFNTQAQDTLDKKVYVLIPFNNWNDIQNLDVKLLKDKKYAADAGAYTDALYTAAPYARFEVIILKTFTGMLQPAVPAIPGQKSERVYELRSYESPTEKYHIDKVG
ncbi:MAG: NIPSNAP family containing protein, partial [Mucilaginibacter sp.]